MNNSKKIILLLLAGLLFGAAIFFVSRNSEQDDTKPAEQVASEEIAVYHDPFYNIEFSYLSSFGEPQMMLEGNKACPEEDTYRTPETLSIFDRELRFPDVDLAKSESLIRHGIRFYRMDPEVANNCNDEVLRRLAKEEITGEEFSSFRLAPAGISGFYGVHNEQASRLDTESREQYTLFVKEPDGRILVVQPYMSFIPYFDSPEWAEIEEGYKGDILSYVKKGKTSEQIREFLVDFRRTAESLRIAGSDINQIN